MNNNLFTTASIAAFALLSASAWAQPASTEPVLSMSKGSGQTYPNRPIRIVVPGTAGSANDFTARAIAQRFTEAWGQQIVIDNRSGAGGVIAHEIAAKDNPDGYTLIFSTSAGLVINPLLFKTPYDSFRDLAPISLG